MDFFVMLYTQTGSYTPMVMDCDDIAKFETEDEARRVATDNPLGEAFGFEIFEIGTGSQY